MIAARESTAGRRMPPVRNTTRVRSALRVTPPRLSGEMPCELDFRRVECLVEARASHVAWWRLREQPRQCGAVLFAASAFEPGARRSRSQLERVALEWMQERCEQPCNRIVRHSGPIGFHVGGEMLGKPARGACTVDVPGDRPRHAGVIELFALGAWQSLHARDKSLGESARSTQDARILGKRGDETDDSLQADEIA
jgi:hypothetical protein